MIVVDTNIWISASLLPDAVPAKALEHVIREGRLAVSPQLVAEVVSVLRRPKFRGRLDAAVVERLGATLHAVAR